MKDEVENKIEEMTSLQLAEDMIAKMARCEINHEQYMALYDVYCAKRKAEICASRMA